MENAVHTVAIALIIEAKKGISSLSLSRQVGINKTTAWFVLQRLRHVGKNFSLQTEFSGITETAGSKIKQMKFKNYFQIDEAYIGGSETNKHANKKNRICYTDILPINSTQ